MGKNGFRLYHESTPETGKDLGVKQMAEEGSYAGLCVAEYIWIDSEGATRCKSYTVTHTPKEADDCLIKLYNGSGSGQATETESDIYLVPRAVFADPWRGGANVMLFCEAVTTTMEPAAGNFRAMCNEVMSANAEHEPWFGIEQEYMCLRPGKMGTMSGVPAGFNADDTPYDPLTRGKYYCGAGGHLIPKDMRAMMDDHYSACMIAGVKISGCNMECSPGQGEYQIGPCKGSEIGDHAMMARHLLHQAAEKYGITISLVPKPVTEGNIDGNGMHVNVSTKQTRGEGGMANLERIAKALGRHSKDAAATHGAGNNYRLTGTHQTATTADYTYGVSDRNASIRIPRNVGMTGRGYLEDRRPGANADPYQACAFIMKATGDALTSALA